MRYIYLHVHVHVQIPYMNLHKIFIVIYCFGPPLVVFFFFLLFFPVLIPFLFNLQTVLKQHHNFLEFFDDHTKYPCQTSMALTSTTVRAVILLVVLYDILSSAFFAEALVPLPAPQICKYSLKEGKKKKNKIKNSFSNLVYQAPREKEEQKSGLLARGLDHNLYYVEKAYERISGRLREGHRKALRYLGDDRIEFIEMGNNNGHKFHYTFLSSDDFFVRPNKFGLYGAHWQGASDYKKTEFMDRWKEAIYQMSQEQINVNNVVLYQVEKSSSSREAWDHVNSFQDAPAVVNVWFDTVKRLMFIEEPVTTTKPEYIAWAIQRAIAQLRADKERLDQPPITPIGLCFPFDDSERSNYITSRAFTLMHQRDGGSMDEWYIYTEGNKGYQELFGTKEGEFLTLLLTQGANPNWTRDVPYVFFYNRAKQQIIYTIGRERSRAASEVPTEII